MQSWPRAKGPAKHGKQDLMQTLAVTPLQAAIGPKVTPGRWIGYAGQNDQVFCKWPPRSPDLTVRDFFLWGYVKDRVYVPPLPASVDELQECITATVTSVTPDMLQSLVQARLSHRCLPSNKRGAH